MGPGSRYNYGVVITHVNGRKEMGKWGYNLLIGGYKI